MEEKIEQTNREAEYQEFKMNHEDDPYLDDDFMNDEMDEAPADLFDD